MRTINVTAIILILFFSGQLLSSDRLQINDSFIETWEQTENIIVPFQYDKIPLELKLERYSPFSCSLNIFDRNDPFLGPRNLPFADLIVDTGTNNTAHLIEFSKTTNVSGKAGIELMLTLLKQMRITSCKVEDDARIISCKKNETWCHNRAGYYLPIFGAILFKSCYYEHLGATPNNQYHHNLTGFLHTVPLNYLKSDLFALRKKYDEAEKLHNFLQEIQNRLSLDETVTFGKMARELYEKGKTNQIDHLLWHDFSDSFIGNKNSFLNELILEFLESEQVKRLRPLVEILEQLGQDNIINLYSTITGEGLEISKRLECEFLNEYYKDIHAYLDHLTDKTWMEMKEDENPSFSNLNKESVYELLLTSFHQPTSDLDSMKKLCRLVFSSNEEFHLNSRTLAELLQNWEDEINTLPEGYLWVLFQAAKSHLQACRFTFDLTNDQDLQDPTCAKETCTQCHFEATQDHH